MNYFRQLNWRLTIVCTCALLNLSGCAHSDPFADRQRFKPLRLKAEEGEATSYIQLERHATRGNPEAQNQIARFHFNKAISASRNSIPNSEIILAKEWWIKASNQGYAPASYNMGYSTEIFWRDYGIKDELTSQEDAISWYKTAVQQGDPVAGYRIWYIWFRDVVNSSTPFKNLKTGKTFTLGAITPPIPADEAMRWLVDAAEYGHGEAQYWLAGMYSDEKSKFLSPSYSEAYFWGKVFLKSKNRRTMKIDEKSYLNSLSKGLSEVEREKIDIRAAKWKPKPILWPQQND